jgi:predicted dehydrogenase
VSAAERSIPVGVIGVGHLGSIHARIYSDLPGIRLVGVADRDADRARDVARAHGCEAYGDASELIGKIEAASVAVPTEAHLEVAATLLEAGVHVLVEKPLARTVEEADSIVATAERCSRRVMVGHSERFHPAVIALAREVDSPRFFEIHRLAAFSSRSTDIDVVLDLMIHDLDLLLYLDGTDPVAIDAVGVNALTDRVDIANARIRMASGAVANLTASRISAEAVRRVRVFQAQTYLACDTGQRTLERYRLEPGEGPTPRIVHEQLEIEEAEPLGLELAAFVASVRAGTPPPVDARQGRRVLELAHRVRSAIEAG